MRERERERERESGIPLSYQYQMWDATCLQQLLVKSTILLDNVYNVNIYRYSYCQLVL